MGTGSASIEVLDDPEPDRTSLAPFRARKEPAIDDTSVQRVRVVLALGIVNLFLAAAAILLANPPQIR